MSAACASTTRTRWPSPRRCTWCATAMGGHAAREVASEIAVDVICDRAPAHPDASALGQAVEEANLAIIRAAREGVGRAGMGCTCTAAILEKDKLVIAQVGDSRAYSCTRGRCSSSPATTRLWPTLSRPGKLPRPRPGMHPQRSGHHPRFGQRPAHPARLVRNHRGSRRPPASVLRWPFHHAGR